MTHSTNCDDLLKGLKWINVLRGDEMVCFKRVDGLYFLGFNRQMIALFGEYDQDKCVYSQLDVGLITSILRNQGINVDVIEVK